MTRYIITVLLAVAASNVLASTPNKPTIIASIKPLALIAQDIAGDNAEVLQLIPPGRSPHTYTLKVSDRRKIQRADILLHIGSSMDGFVGKVAHKEQVLISADQLHAIQWPTGDIDHEHNHHHTQGDPHLWLNPGNALAIAYELATQLALVDADNSSEYRKAASQFAKQISRFEHRAEHQFAGLPKRSFIVQHDAYLHFVNRYQLHQLGSLRTTSGAKAGAKTMQRLLKQGSGQGSDIACVLIDPQFDTQVADIYSATTGIKQVVLDPLGSQVTAKPQQLGYLSFLDGFLDAFQRCLTASIS
ncbi:zinc ABC transporter substrate-binding protein [bacterium SCSIO 12696]|nr:zinc ABC transporter substrate-binding protein [bacterium SCSIO 12696]